MEINIVKDAKILSQPAEKIDFSAIPFDIVDVVNSMHQHIFDVNAYGLAAPQIGLPYQLFVMRGDVTCINPKVIHVSEGNETLEEGCLSFPGLVMPVKRSSSCRVRYQNINGEVITSSWHGLTARTAMHEIDHLYGILFYNRANYYHRSKAFKKAKLASR